MTPLPPAVRSLFTAPFSAFDVDGRVLFIYDANVDMVASRRDDKPIARGGYLLNGAEIHDAWCAWFRENVPESATLDEAAAILNRAWSIEP